VVAYFPEYEPEISRPRLGRGWIGWVIITILAIAIGVTAAQPTNLAIEQPGPVFDTLGTTTVDEEDVPVIDIPMETSYPTTGSLDMLTVQTIGSPERPATVLQVVGAWLDKSQAIIPLDELYPPGQTGQQSEEIAQQQMLQSQQDAIAAALTVVGRDYTQQISVVEASAGGASEGILQKDDVLQSMNNVPITSLEVLRDALAANGTDKPALIEILRDGKLQTVKVTPTIGTGEVAGPVLGIQIMTTYQFPFEVQIQLDRVGGPSAGQIFALAIIDKLTPGALTGGNIVAGTGTVDPDGMVGPIGGIQQKMFAAKGAGAKYFLAPESNCDEVTGHIPNGLQVFAVKTLGDSLAVLNTVSSGASTSLLPTCPLE
jgi:Lon-like protease